MIAQRPPQTIAQIGNVFQMAFVPQDFDAAIRFWTRQIGVGPFYYLEHMPLTGIRYRGEPGSLDMSVALGYWGDVQIELFKLHDRSPSIYKEFYDIGNEGLHHVCIAVDDAPAASVLLEREGGVLVQEMYLGKSHASYFEMPGPSPMIELAQLSPELMVLFALMRREARSWDGADPLRPVSGLDTK